MPVLNFTVEPYLSGVRVDSFLSRHLRNYTTWRLLRMVEAGLVTINDLPADITQRVFRGQSVSIRLCEPPDKLLAPDCLPLSVVWEDPWVVVIDKPAGLVAHPVGDYQQDTLANAVQSHLDQQTTAKGLLRPGIVHRLDRMTSGLIAVTKEHLSHRQLSLDIQRGQTTKTYVAIVAGCVSWEQRSITLPIGQHPPQVSHRQHTVGKYIRHAGLFGEVRIDMDRIMITRRAGVQCQRIATDGGQLQGRYFGTNLYITHNYSPQPLRTTSVLVARVVRTLSWLV